MLSSTSFTKEGVERVIATTHTFIGRHLSIWLNSMLQTIQFPAGITDLGTGLTNMDGDTLTLNYKSSIKPIRTQPKPREKKRTNQEFTYHFR